MALTDKRRDDDPAANTFNGKPIDINAGAKLPTVPAFQPQAQPTASPLAIAQQAATGIDAAARNAQGRVNATTGPGSADAETMRRLEIAAGGNKGNRSARQAIMGALAGQLDASRAAATAGVAPIATALQQGAQAQYGQDLQQQAAGQRADLQAQIGGQQLALDAQQQAGETRRTELGIAGDLDVAKLSRQPVGAYQRDANGNLALVQGATATPVTTADGTPFAGQPGGDITAADRFKAYQERAAAIESALMTPEQKQAQRLALQQDPMFASLFAAGQQQPTAAATKPPASAAEFIQVMRAQGSKMSDAELTSYYNANYGQK